MKYPILVFFFFILFRTSAQTNGQLFVEQKLNVFLSIAVKDLESIKTQCSAEGGMVHYENTEDVYTYSYQSPEQDYLLNVNYYFNRLFCKKIKIEIVPIDKEDLIIGKSVLKTVKKKFKIQKATVTDGKLKTINYFTSNAMFSGILILNQETKKIDLILSLKTD